MNFCKNKNCNKGPNGIRANIQSTKVYCCNECRLKGWNANQTEEMLQAKRENGKKMGQLFGKTNGSKNITFVNENYKDIVFKNRSNTGKTYGPQNGRVTGLKYGKINGSKFLKQLSEFKKSHLNMAPSEWEFWISIKNDPRFQEIEIIPQDRRFFHSRYGGFSLDFYMPSFKLDIELDFEGGGNIGHNTNRDNYRDKYLLENYGVKTIRIKNCDVKSNISSILDKIVGELHVSK